MRDKDLHRQLWLETAALRGVHRPCTLEARFPKQVFV